MLTLAVTAAPPFQTQEVNNILPSIIIKHPVFFSYPFNTNISLNFDVLNSTFKPLSGSEVDCEIHVTNSLGTIISDGNLVHDTIRQHWYYVLKEEEINDTSVYAYYVHCNSTGGEFGSLSRGITVTSDGNIVAEDLSPIAVTILIPLFLALLCIALVAILGDGHAPIKLFLIIASFFAVMVSYNYAIKVIGTFYYSSSLVAFIASDYAWLGWFIYIIVIYFILYWIKVVFNYLQGKKDNSLRFNNEKT